MAHGSMVTCSNAPGRRAAPQREGRGGNNRRADEAQNSSFSPPNHWPPTGAASPPSLRPPRDAQGLVPTPSRAHPGRAWVQVPRCSAPCPPPHRFGPYWADFPPCGTAVGGLRRRRCSRKARRRGRQVHGNVGQRPRPTGSGTERAGGVGSWRVVVKGAAVREWTAHTLGCSLIMWGASLSLWRAGNRGVLSFGPV